MAAHPGPRRKAPVDDGSVPPPQSEVRHLLTYGNDPAAAAAVADATASLPASPSSSHAAPLAIPRGVVFVSAAIATSLLGDQLLYTVLPTIHDSVGVTVEMVGVLLSMNRFVRLFTNTLSGWVLDRFGRRWPFVAALAVAAATTAGYSAYYGLWMFLAARVSWGICWSFIRIEGMSTALDLATPATKGRLMGIYQSIARLGGAAGMLFGGVMTDAFGYSVTFLIFGIAAAAGPVLAGIEMCSRGPDGIARHRGASPLPLPDTAVAGKDGVEEDDDEEEGDTAAAGPSGDGGDGDDLDKIESQPLTSRAPAAAAAVAADGGDGAESAAVAAESGPSYLCDTSITFFGGCCNRLVVDGVLTSMLGYVLQSRYGDMPAFSNGLAVPVASLTGTLLSSRGLVEMAVAPLTGFLGDKYGRRKVAMVTTPVLTTLVATLVFTTPLWWVVACIPLIYVCGVTLSVTFNTISGELAPAATRSSFLSRYLTTNDLGAALGPLMAYTLAPAYGIDLVFTLSVGLLLAFGVLYMFTFAKHHGAGAKSRPD